MKLTNKQLRQIIKEELEYVMGEGYGSFADPPSDAYRPEQGSGMDEAFLGELAKEAMKVYQSTRGGSISQAIHKALRTLDPSATNSTDVKALYFEITDMFGGDRGFQAKAEEMFPYKGASEQPNQEITSGIDAFVAKMAMGRNR